MVGLHLPKRLLRNYGTLNNIGPRTVFVIRSFRRCYFLAPRFNLKLTLWIESLNCFSFVT